MTSRRALVTAQHVLGYNLPGGSNVMLSQLNQLAYKPCTRSHVRRSGTTQTGFDPGDYGQPLTFAYNFTIDQKLKWNSVLDVAYVGSQTSQLSDNSEGIEGSNFAAVADQNKTPLGAFFKPDPITGVLSTNPENSERIPMAPEEHQRKHGGRLSPLRLTRTAPFCLS